MPKVSFILPAYKRRFLHEAIASILAQTYRDFELVVVDDCSPEDLKSVVDEFHDERLSYHRNAENLGGKDLVAAWNHAMEYARGEWCVLASDDDVYLPWFLEELMKLHEKYPQCDLFHARNADIDADGKWTSVAFPRPEFESQIELAYARSALRLPQRAPDFMFRILAWKEVGGFVKFPLAWYTDDATWITLSKNGCVHTREVEFCFRHSGENLSSLGDDHVEEKIAAAFAYEKWARAKAGDMRPRNEVERLMLKSFVETLRDRIMGLAIKEVDLMPEFSRWWKCVCSLDNAWSFKRGRIYARYPRLRALRTLLPHWRH